MKEKQKLEMRDIFMPEDLITSYSREQAIDDGVLVDVSQVAREAGIKFPVALSHLSLHPASLDEEAKARPINGQPRLAAIVTFWHLLLAS